jgi:quercetin dioxygenase-like cupin family protein
VASPTEDRRPIALFIDWDHAPLAESMRAKATRRVVSGRQTSVLRVTTEPDAHFDGRQHRHPNEQWVVVLDGRLRMSCAGTEREMGPGDVLYVPTDAWHAALGVGDQGARYLEISTPPRLDLLPGSLVPSPLEFDPALPVRP